MTYEKFCYGQTMQCIEPGGLAKKMFFLNETLQSNFPITWKIGKLTFPPWKLNHGKLSDFLSKCIANETNLQFKRFHFFCLNSNLQVNINFKRSVWRAPYDETRPVQYFSEQCSNFCEPKSSLILCTKLNLAYLG